MLTNGGNGKNINARGLLRRVAIGSLIALTSTILMPQIKKGIKPLVKKIAEGAFTLAESTNGFYENTRKYISDIIDEAKGEREKYYEEVRNNNIEFDKSLIQEFKKEREEYIKSIKQLEDKIILLEQKVSDDKRD